MKNERGSVSDGVAIGGGCLLVVGLVLAALLASWALVFASFGIRVATAGLVGRGEAHIQVQSANFRLQAYDHFHDLCSAIQGNEHSIDILEDQLALTTTERSKDILRTSIAGTRSARESGIAKYNEDAKKNYTIGQFRDNQLPWQIDTTPYVKGAYTQCATD